MHWKCVCGIIRWKQWNYCDDDDNDDDDVDRRMNCSILLLLVFSLVCLSLLRILYVILLTLMPNLNT